VLFRPQIIAFWDALITLISALFTLENSPFLALENTRFIDRFSIVFDLGINPKKHRRFCLFFGLNIPQKLTLFFTSKRSGFCSYPKFKEVGRRGIFSNLVYIIQNHERKSQRNPAWF